MRDENCQNWSTETKDIAKIKVAQFFSFGGHMVYKLWP